MPPRRDLRRRLDPNVSGVSSPRNLTFDGTSGVMWLRFSEAAVKYTADRPLRLPRAAGPRHPRRRSGVCHRQRERHQFLFNVHYSFWGNGIEALNERGGRAEDVFGCRRAAAATTTRRLPDVGGTAPPKCLNPMSWGLRSTKRPATSTSRTTASPGRHSRNSTRWAVGTSGSIPGSAPPTPAPACRPRSGKPMPR